MMKVQKWDFEKHKYERVENKYVEAYVEAITFGDIDFEEAIQCANCGKEMQLGESIVSDQWHDFTGFGYPVCESCSNAEWEKWNREKAKENAKTAQK